MHIDRSKSGTNECGRHFVLAVDALLPKYGHARSGPAAIRADDVVARVESQFDVEARILVVEDAVILLERRRRVVPQRLDAVTHRRPFALHRLAIQLQHHVLAAAYGQLGNLFDAADSRCPGSRAIEHHLNLRKLVLRHLHDGADLLREQTAEHLLVRTIELQRHTKPACEHHLGHRRQQSAVTAIVIR